MDLRSSVHVPLIHLAPFAKTVARRAPMGFFFRCRKTPIRNRRRAGITRRFYPRTPDMRLWHAHIPLTKQHARSHSTLAPSKVPITTLRGLTTHSVEISGDQRQRGSLSYMGQMQRLTLCEALLRYGQQANVDPRAPLVGGAFPIPDSAKEVTLMQHI